MGQHSFAKQRFTSLNIAFGKLFPLTSDDRVTLFNTKEAEQHRRVYSRQQRINFEAQIKGQTMQICSAT